MISDLLSEKAGTYLRRLCEKIPGRCVGSKGNRAGTDFFAGIVASFGFETESPEFDCIEWTQGGARLTIDGETFEVFVSPYTLACHISAPLVIASIVEELEASEISNKILLLRGDIAKEQLMPKNFTFYNPDHHKRIVHLLESKKPQAIIAATSRNPELAGAVYPFPLIEDGDFDIPSVYMTEEEGKRLAEHSGRKILLDIKAKRIPSKGCNVIARKGADPNRRVVLFAHIDAKDGTPGATDNATGIVVLLLLAELLANYSGSLGIEIVALNGEDYYSAPGEMQYLGNNAGKFSEIILGINIDGVGYHQGKTAYSLYDCPPDIAGAVREMFSLHKGIVEGEPWYQGDHGLFLMNKRPALAITSERLTEILTEIVHTPKDNPEIVDSTKVAEVAVALRDLLLHLDNT
ncbi:MAG: M28 family peptidase [Candidatus Tritonobacter lacicola]|nr:M28 family peptidase [Candidatus Tritonobacter lacicola]